MHAQHACTGRLVTCERSSSGETTGGCGLYYRPTGVLIAVAVPAGCVQIPYTSDVIIKPVTYKI